MENTLNELILSFIPAYPSIKNDIVPYTTENFEYNIARRKEFNELRLPRSEPKPEKQGDLYLSQQIFQRFFSPHTNNRNALVIHGTGVGKSCLAAILGEAYKNEGGGKTLILQKSDELIDKIQREIANVCTVKGTYEPHFKERETKRTEKIKESRTKKQLAATYEFKTFGTFLKQTSKMSKNAIKLEYSNRIIIIDEAHNLRIQPDKKEETLGQYNKLHKFLHRVENCRVFLLTATPIWDSSWEIASLLNLLLPLDKQLPVDKEFMEKYFDGDKFIPDNTFRRAVRGKVSYLRGQVTNADRIEIGQTEPYTKYIKVFPDAMSSFQEQVVQEASERMDDKTDTSGKTKGGSFLKYSRNASNFVFPDGSYGSEGYKKHALRHRVKEKGTHDSVEFDDITKQEVKNNLGKLSSKYESIINIIKEHPTELVYIYCELVTGSGGLVLALCLQALGFKWIKNVPTILSDDDEKHDDNRRGFAIISSNTETTSGKGSVGKMIDAFSSPQNKYGKYIQVLIGSKKISEGITLKNVRQLHIVMPHWNLSALDQASGRIIRNLSHESLPENERYVHIYRHVAVTKNPSVETPDIYIYRKAEDKDKKNTLVYRFLKIMAFDCSLMYQRNVIEGDVNGSRECDYMDCNYECYRYPVENIHVNLETKNFEYTVPEKEILYDTYNLFYSFNERKKLAKRIISIFRDIFLCTLKQLFDMLELKPVQLRLLLLTLQDMIDERVTIINKYGFECYLKEKNNIIFIDYTIESSTVSDSSTASYVKYPIAYSVTSFENFMEGLQLKQDEKEVCDFCENPSTNKFKQLNYKTKIIVLEYVYSLKTKQSNMSANEKNLIKIIDKELGNDIFEIDIGRAKIAHILYSREYTGTSYSISTKNLNIPSKKMRVMDIDGYWSFVTNPKLEIEYLQKIKNKPAKSKKTNNENADDNNDEDVEHDENKFGIYGFVSKIDGKFRIKKDVKGTTGRVCTSYDKDEILQMLRTVNATPSIGISEDALEKSKEQLIEDIMDFENISGKSKENLDTMSQEDLQKYYTFIPMSKPKLCKELEHFFKSSGLLKQM